MIKYWIALIRPVNVVITVVAVYAGGVICLSSLYSGKLLLAGLAAGLIAAFGNIVNDLYDLELDKKSKGHRPLPAALISIRDARIAAAVFASAGIVLACFVGGFCCLLAFANVMLLWLYTPVFKGRGYWGNILIALICASAFPFGGLAAGNISGSFFPALFAFALNLLREIIKDMEDLEADSSFAIKTGAVLYGVDVSRKFAVAVGLALLILTPLPFCFNLYGSLYLAVVIAAVDIPLLLILAKLLRSRSSQEFRTLSGLLKMIMPAGLIALFLGSRGYGL